MTTIATDGKTLAGDGQADIADTIVSLSRVKVQRLSDGSLLGCAGKATDGALLAAFLENGGARPKLSSFSALRVMPDRTILYYGDSADPVTLDAPAAIGSGADHALTALDLGCSPEKAVEMAAKRDPFTGGKITVLSL